MALTTQQIMRLLTPRPGSIFEKKQNNTYIPTHEVKAELTRIFGPGNWDHTIHDVTLLYETEITKGHPQFPRNAPDDKVYWVACYRTACTLRIRDYWGTEVAATTEYHAEENAPLPNRGEAHAMALTSAQSYSLRRAALDFGDSFGLHLYDAGKTSPLIKGSLQLTEEREQEYKTILAEKAAQAQAGQAQLQGSLKQHAQQEPAEGSPEAEELERRYREEAPEQ